MAVNNMTTEQAYTFMTALYEEATGKQASIVVKDTGTFTTVGQAVLKTGYDNVMSSISKVLGRTIFAVRPYTAKFKGIDASSERWGAITREISFADTGIEQDERIPLTDGSSVDMFKVKKPVVLELNFVGENVYQKHITIFRDQLDTAFASPADFAAFISGVMTTFYNELEQYREAQSRDALINFIAGKKAGDSANVINVLQEYYNETGVQLTPTTMYNVTNFKPFTEWLYSFVNTLTDRMSERTELFHTKITNKPIMRHTPYNKLKMYMSAGVANKIDHLALANIFNPEKLKMVDFEKVTFWQNINDPYKVSAKPTYLQANGTLKTETNAVTVANIVGLLFDEDAIAITKKSSWMGNSPFNVAGGYYNVYAHETVQMLNNFSHNGVVLIADTVQA